MNRTRIVVSTVSPEPPSPRFDDEATLVSARPVVPLARVKTVERSRASLLIVAGLLAAGASGAVAAFGVNYYENRRHEAVASSAQTQADSGPQADQSLVSEPQSAALAPSDSPAGGVTSAEPPSPSETSASSPETSANQAGNLSAAESERATSSDKLAESPAKTKAESPKASETGSDPGQLMRQRRVITPAAEPPTPRTRQLKIGKRGAGRIQEIFEGRDPK